MTHTEDETARQDADTETFEDHFISGDIEEVVIEGATFVLREMDGQEQDAMKSAAHQFDSDGNFVEFDVGAKHNHLLKKAVVDAPDYNGIATERYGQPFSDLGDIDKLDLLNDLRGTVREKLLDECLRKQGLSDDEKN